MPGLPEEVSLRARAKVDVLLRAEGTRRAMSLFLLTKRRESGDSVRFDLLVAGQQVLRQVTFMAAFRHLLEYMADEDRYQERLWGDDDEDIVEVSGAELRKVHAERLDDITTLPQLPCTRFDGPTTVIGYCDIRPYGPMACSAPSLCSAATAASTARWGFRTRTT